MNRSHGDDDQRRKYGAIPLMRNHCYGFLTPHGIDVTESLSPASDTSHHNVVVAHTPLELECNVLTLILLSLWFSSCLEDNSQTDYQSMK